MCLCSLLPLHLLCWRHHHTNRIICLSSWGRQGSPPIIFVARWFGFFNLFLHFEKTHQPSRRCVWMTMWETHVSHLLLKLIIYLSAIWTNEAAAAKKLELWWIYGQTFYLFIFFIYFFPVLFLSFVFLPSLKPVYLQLCRRKCSFWTFWNALRQIKYVWVIHKWSAMHITLPGVGGLGGGGLETTFWEKPQHLLETKK